MEAQTKQEREREFHDHAYSEFVRERVWGFYDITASSQRCFEELVAREQPAGRRVLEFGCGLSAQAYGLAARGAHVTGIDISPVAIEKARAKAEEAGVAANTEFVLMDAEALDFAPGTFDLAVGNSVIHHLDLAKAYEGTARVLKPAGAAIFREPMGHNALINLYRRRTP